MAAGEDQAEPVVDRAHRFVLGFPGGVGGIEYRQALELLTPDAFAAQAIDRAAPREWSNDTKRYGTAESDKRHAVVKNRNCNKRETQI